MNDFSQYYSYCPICSAKVELFDNYCSVCGHCLTLNFDDEPVTEWEDNTTTADFNGVNGLYTCPKCGLLYLGEEGCPVCTPKIEKLPTYSTPTNAELRDKLNKVIRRLNDEI